MFGSLGGDFSCNGFAVSVYAIFSLNNSPLINGSKEIPSIDSKSLSIFIFNCSSIVGKISICLTCVIISLSLAIFEI